MRRERLYSVHCIRKHVNGIITRAREVMEKLCTYYANKNDEFIPSFVKEVTKHIITIQKILHVLTPEITEDQKDKYIEGIILFIAILRSLRVYLDNLKDKLMQYDTAVIFEINEIVGDAWAAECHAFELIEEVVEKFDMKENLDKQGTQ